MVEPAAERMIGLGAMLSDIIASGAAPIYTAHQNLPSGSDLRDHSQLAPSQQWGVAAQA